MTPFRLLALCVAIVAGCTASAQAEVRFRLFEIPVTRFTPTSDGRARLELGHLNAEGRLRIMETHDVGRPPRTADEAFGKLLVSSEAWFAFQSLGPEAVANFERINNGIPIPVSEIPHYVVGVHPDAQLTVGKVVNLSTRGIVAAGTTPALIGGFVIEGQNRRVLVRAIGPSLAPFGVTDAVADPFVYIQKGTLTIRYNGNWGDSHDADDNTRVSAEVGAFPLARSSKDAALIVELPPGEYTASVVSESTPTTGGVGLLEIYILP